MALPRLLVIGLLVSTFAVRADGDWTSLWNGKDLDGWTTWMQRPVPTSEVSGLKRDADGKYLEPIGSGRDPLKVFTVAPDVDGRPAIRISGEVFGELRTRASFKNYHLKLQFKWGEKRWPPRDGPGTPRDSGLLYHVHAAPGVGRPNVGALCRTADPGTRRRRSLRGRIGHRRSRQGAAGHDSRDSTTTIRPVSGRSSRRARARRAGASSSPTTRSPRASGTPSS